MLSTLASITTVFGSFDFEAGTLIPIVAIAAPFLFAFAMVAIGASADARKQKLRHDTIRLAIEKGQPIPADVLEVDASKKKRDDRRSGLILIAVGVGSFFFLRNFTGFAGERGLEWAALIPGLIGVAMLISWALDRATKKDST
jgi:hypothetical protein